MIDDAARIQLGRMTIELETVELATLVRDVLDRSRNLTGDRLIELEVIPRAIR